MATTVASSADQTTELLQNLSLDSSKPKPLEIPDPAKGMSVYQYGAVDSGAPAADGGQVQPAEQPQQQQRQQRSASPFFADAMDPTVCYLANGYGSPAYYYGSYNGTGNEWDDYSRYVSADGVEMTSGVYGENGSFMYPNGYGYGAYAPYSPATSPVPTLGNDNQLYAPQQYQYPPYFQPLIPSSVPFTPSRVPSAQPELSTTAAADQKLPLGETAKGNSGATPNGGGVKANNSSAPHKPTYQNSYGGTAWSGSIPANSYQDPRFGYDGQYKNTRTESFSKTNNYASPRSYDFRQNSNYVGLQHPSPVSMGSNYGYMNKVYPNKYFSQYGNNFRSDVGYGSGYDSRVNAHGWLAADNKYKSKGRGNGYFSYHNDNVDGFNELNRGPRAKSFKSQKAFAPITLAVKGQDLPSSAAAGEAITEKFAIPDQEQYNRADFPEDYANAKFFIIKSYSEDDIHKSIKYNVWSSTPNGNKKLDAAYQEAQQKSGCCPVFLFFSVNTSGQFVGLAEMVGPVDFQKNVEYWQQDKWTGCFPLKWHIVKDVPNNLLKHIILENNENKPVTNSRDTQDVKLDQGLQVIKIFKHHSSRTCILDDFEFYEKRQKIVQEKKAKQQQFQKQVLDVKCNDEKEVTNESHKSPEAPNIVSEPKSNGEAKHLEDRPVAKTKDASVASKPVASETVLANGFSNGC